MGTPYFLPICIMQNSNNELFPTKDICLATVLYALGVPLTETFLDTVHHARVYVFRRTSAFDDIIWDYFSGDVTIEPMQFLKVYEYLLTLAHHG